MNEASVSPKSHQPMSAALASLLEERGMTQAQLWRAAGVSQGAISRYLSGTRGTRIDSRGARALEKVAAALGVGPEHFLEYRAWRVRQVALDDPALADDLYDLMVETMRLRALSEGALDEPHQ
jgi:transcriptional regulator with XRE-family HTH domain